MGLRWTRSPYLSTYQLIFSSMISWIPIVPFMSRLPCGSLSDRDDARVNPSAEKPPSTGLLAKAISNKSPADIGFQLPFSSAFVVHAATQEIGLGYTGR